MNVLPEGYTPSPMDQVELYKDIAVIAATAGAAAYWWNVLVPAKVGFSMECV